MPSSPLLLASALYTASAGVSVDPTEPPLLEARYDDGGVRIRFPGRGPSLDSVGAAVVTVREGAEVPERLRAAGQPIGAARRHWRVPVAPGQDALALALEWADDPAVEAAIPDVILPKIPAASFDDPEYGGQWYIEELGMDALFDRSLGDPEIRIGVIDSAIDVAHPDIAPAVVAPLDLVDDDDDPSPVPGFGCIGEGCLEDHGTAVSGIVGARANNGEGMVGLCPECSIVPVRLLGENSLSADIAAFEHMIEQDAAVINNSWGFAESIVVPSGLEEVIDRAARRSRGGKGAVVVFAAGNNSREIEPGEMQAMERVVCVSAVDRYGLPTNFTNSGNAVDVAAPAATVSIAPNGGTTTSFGGTSSAAPVVSGVVGWLLSQHPELSALQVRELLAETAYKTSQVTFIGGHHPLYGYGQIDPLAMLEELEAPDPDLGVEEEPRGCGCGVAPGPAGAGVGAMLGALGLIVRRRR